MEGQEQPKLIDPIETSEGFILSPPGETWIYLGKLNAAVLAVMRKVHYIQREKVAGTGMTGVMESAVLGAVRPAMLEHGLTLLPVGVTVHPQPPTTSKDGKVLRSVILTERFRLTHVPSGEFIEISSAGEAADTSDKSVVKALTTSLKTVLRRMFLIETGKGADPDRANPQHFDAETGHVKPPRQPTQEEVLAEIAAAQAAAEKAANPPAEPSPQAAPEPDADSPELVTREQCEEIERNFTALNTNGEKQAKILADRGVKFLRELTQIQAAELIAAQAKVIAKRAAEAKAKN